MQRLLVVFAILFVSVSNSWAWPTGYNMIDSRSGFKTYVSKDGNILVVEAETGKSKITFGVGPEFSVNKYGYRQFKKMPIEGHYDMYGNSDNLYMALNGQFFNLQGRYSALSMHVKINGDILMPDIKEVKYGQRLFAVLKNGYPVVYKGVLKYDSSGKQINKGAILYQIKSLVNNDVVKNAISGFDPFDPSVLRDKVRPRSKTGRNMIGCQTYTNTKSNSIVVCKKTFFFIAKKTSYYDLINEMKRWNIDEKSIVTLDGSHSAQAYSEILSGKDRFIFRDKIRPIPNSILIYTK